MSNFTVAQALMHAHAHRQKGEVEQARTLLQSVLATSPKNTRARRELGSLNQEYPELAVQNPPKHQIDALVDGFKNGDLEDVIGKAEMLSLQFPDSFAVWNILGATNERTGRFEQAIQAFKQAIRLSPTNHAVHYNIGNALRRQGKLDEAVTAYRKALSIKPDYVGAHNNIGVALREQGRLDEAIAAYQRALAVRPDYVEAYKNLGTALYEQHRLDEAIATYRKALSIRPDYVEAYNNMGVALREQGRLDDAIAAYRKALAVKPDYVEAYNNLSVALREHGSLHEAIRACRQALSINPGYAEAHNSMGNALRDLGQLDEAIDSFNLCIRIKPDHAEAHSNLSHGLLLLGQLAPGFAEYEWRKNTNRPLGNRLYPKPLWTGAETISGKTLLLHHEQGLGDTIQVARYVPRLVKLGARVLLAPQKNLGCLLGNLGEAISIVDADDPTLEYDYHLPMMSLPHAFRTTLETIPNEVPYLFPRSDLVDKWRDRLGADNFKIGICWKGSDGKVDRDRSFNVREFLLLSKIPNVRLISLHKGSGERELQDLPNGMVVETLGQDFDSGRNAFLDTAAVISLCDLVVTSDTAVAHLAGALGAPTWIVLKHLPDWRWMRARVDTPWYPTARLFRQQTAGDWAGVFHEMQAALVEELAKWNAPGPQQQLVQPEVPISWGELIDKITILEIKIERLENERQRRNAKNEWNVLAPKAKPALANKSAINSLKKGLCEVNKLLWDIENELREKEAQRDFGDAFVELARSVYHHNDERARIKRQINVALKSALVEEKSYKGADRPDSSYRG